MTSADVSDPGENLPAASVKHPSRAKSLLQSSIIFSAINFATGMGNMFFQVIIGHNLPKQGDYANANTAINAFMPLLALIPQMAIMAVTHYIAHFNAIGDTARLQGLLAGCRKFLLQLTIGGSVLALVAIKPLCAYFNYTNGMMVVVLIGTLVGLWTSLATALCQGLSWFNRFAVILFLGMLLRVAFGYVTTLYWRSPEPVVLASTFGMLSFLILLYWRKELKLPAKTEAKMPWNHEFVLYLTVSAAFVVGNYCFSLSDMLVIQRYFTPGDQDNYAAAERLAIAVPIIVAPMLTVLFTNRSVEHTADALQAQLKLIAVFAFGLICGAICLYFMRHLCLKAFSKNTPAAAHMLAHLSASMIFVGLLQALGTWALASRWSRISLLYGVMGIIYTILIMTLGRTPDVLVNIMPFATGIGFFVLLGVWIIAMRRHKPVT